jgi:hypothetical protein
MRFSGTYEIQDGYVGNSRPQTFQITNVDICVYLNQDSTDEEILVAYEEMSNLHFLEHTSILVSKEKEFLEFARNALKE